MSDEISSAIENGFLRRDDKFVQSVFDRFKDQSTNRIPESHLEAALREAHARKYLFPASFEKNATAQEIESDNNAVTMFCRVY